MTGSRYGRREFLGTAAAGLVGSRLTMSALAGPGAWDDVGLAGTLERARAAGLAPVDHSRTEHFQGVGNARAAFRDSALAICEDLGRAFLSHFKDRGFAGTWPSRRMVVVTLQDAMSYAAYLGAPPGKDEGGHYDLGSNQLVIFDHGVDRINLFTLVHETSHQLCFNTGLLDRETDVPDCVSEGLATYLEMWRPRARASIGGVNRPRLQALLVPAESVRDWIDLDELIAKDGWFDDPDVAQLAYAQGWLLAYHFLRVRSRARRFLAYLEAIREEGKPGVRVALAERSLGPLGPLDREMKKEARSLLNR